MKRLITLLIFFISLQLSAQNADDVLISSRYIYEGTARFQALGGAFTALGGDLNSASLNPAGLGLYRSNDFSFSIMGNANKTKSNYLNETNKNNYFRMIMPNIGVGISFPNLNGLSSGTGPESWTFAIGYNQIHTFNKNSFFAGQNNNSSYLDMMLDRNDELFDSVDLIFINKANLWTHDFIESGYGANQEMYMTERGGIGEFFISGATNFNDNLYIGGTIGIQNYYLERSFNITEVPTKDIALKGYDYDYTLTTEGIGVNAKIGVIYSPVYWAKIGLSIHTPTAFTLTDEESATAKATIEYTHGIYDNEYDISPKYPEYNILTPLRINTGVSFLVLRHALLAIDYEFVDYGSAQINSDTYSFNKENRNISNSFIGSHSLRVGTEFNLGMIALRAGGFYYGSPYAEKTINKDSYILGYSAGVGFKSGIMYFDLSFSQQNEDITVAPYSYEISKVENRNTKITTTVGFRF